MMIKLYGGFMIKFNRRSGVAVLAVPLAASAIMAIGVAPAGAATILHCGQTLAVNTVMANNLSCPGGVGLTVLGGVVLNLAGHTLTGPGTGTGIVTDLTPGRAKIKNGTITGWGSGVAGAGEGGAVTSLSGITASHNGIGVDIEPGDGGLLVVGSHFRNNTVAGINTFRNGINTIQTSIFDSNVAGIVSVSVGVTVTDSVFLRNRLAAGSQDGVITLTDTKVEYNHIGLNANSGGSIQVVGGSIFHNGLGITESDLSGFSVTSAAISANTVALQGLGVFGPGNSITDSTITGNGVGYTGYDQVRATGNTFTGNGSAYLTIPDPDLNPDPGADGFNVLPQDLEGNTFSANQNAIVLNGVFAAPNSLGTNRVTDNAGIGIYAPGALDLGGNVAFGNGTFPQCTGVICAGA